MSNSSNTQDIYANDFANDMRIITGLMNHSNYMFHYFDQNSQSIGGFKMNPTKLHGKTLLEYYVSKISSEISWQELTWDVHYCTRDTCGSQTILIPDFIHKTMVNQILCNSCMFIDLILGLFTHHRTHIRSIFELNDEWKSVKKMYIQKIKDAKEQLERNMEECSDCNHYRECGLGITSAITHQERLQRAKKLLNYLLAPLSIHEHSYLTLVKGGLNHDVSERIIWYVWNDKNLN